MNTTSENARAAAGGRFPRVRAAAHGLVQVVGHYAEAAPLRFALVAVLLLQTLVVLAFRPSYATNDDVFLTMIASGTGICPAPDEHLIFTNVVIGKFLKTLYATCPGAPWYGCYLLLVHFAAHTAICYCALVIGLNATCRRTRSDSLPSEETSTPPAEQTLLRCGLYLLYFLLVELPLLNHMQFTTTAFVAAQAGVFLCLLAWQRRTQQADAAVAGPLIAGVSLLVVGGLIRLEGLAMALLVAAPVALVFVRNFSFRAFVPCGIAAGLAGALITAAVAFDHWTYEHDSTWRGFRSFNQLRGTFHDGSWTFYSPETAPIFSRVGWSENDHAMIARWFSDDAQLYSKEKLATVVASYPWQSARRTADLWWTAFCDIARNRSVLSVLLVLPFVLVALRAERNARWAVLGSAMSALALVVLVTWLKKVPPERVVFPLMSFPLSVSLLAFAWQSKDRPAGKWRDAAEGSRLALWSWTAWRQTPLWTRVAVGLMVVAVCMGVYRQCRLSLHIARGRAALERFVDDLQPADQRLYVSWEAALPYQLVSPLDNLDAWSHASFLSLAWTQRTPWHEEIKRRHGIQDLARALIERDDLELVARAEHRELFVQFAKEHYGADVEFVPRFKAGSKILAGRFRPRESAVSTAATPADAVR